MPTHVIILTSKLGTILAIIIIKFHGYFTSSMFNPNVTKVFDDLKWAPIDRGVIKIRRRNM
jgi:uncharacterized membrane protein